MGNNTGHCSKELFKGQKVGSKEFEGLHTHFLNETLRRFQCAKTNVGLSGPLSSCSFFWNVLQPFTSEY